MDRLNHLDFRGSPGSRGSRGSLGSPGSPGSRHCLISVEEILDYEAQMHCSERSECPNLDQKSYAMP